MPLLEWRDNEDRSADAQAVFQLLLRRLDASTVSSQRAFDALALALKSQISFPQPDGGLLID